MNNRATTLASDSHDDSMVQELLIRLLSWLEQSLQIDESLQDWIDDV